MSSKPLHNALLLNAFARDPPSNCLFILGLAAFLRTEHVTAHPMMPLTLFGSRTVVVVVVSGFAFMVAYFGLPFVISLFLQEHRGLSALQTGIVFLPMVLIGLVLTPFSARISERLGRKALIVTGLASMTAGLIAVAVLPATAPLWLLAALMIPVGLGGPTVSPPATAVLLDSVPHDQAGTASGVFNTSRQVGGALAVAVFGGLLANPDTLVAGVQTSLLLAAGVVAIATALSALLPHQPHHGATSAVSAPPAA